MVFKKTTAPSSRLNNVNKVIEDVREIMKEEELDENKSDYWCGRHDAFCEVMDILKVTRNAAQKEYGYTLIYD
jgi:hypothetical protein